MLKPFVDEIRRLSKRDLMRSPRVSQRMRSMSFNSHANKGNAKIMPIIQLRASRWNSCLVGSLMPANSGPVLSQGLIVAAITSIKKKPKGIHKKNPSNTGLLLARMIEEFMAAKVCKILHYLKMHESAHRLQTQESKLQMMQEKQMRMLYQVPETG